MMPSFSWLWHLKDLIVVVFTGSSSIGFEDPVMAHRGRRRLTDLMMPHHGRWRFTDSMMPHHGRRMADSVMPSTVDGGFEDPVMPHRGHRLADPVMPYRVRKPIRLWWRTVYGSLYDCAWCRTVYGTAYSDGDAAEWTMTWWPCMQEALFYSVRVLNVSFNVSLKNVRA